MIFNNNYEKAAFIERAAYKNLKKLYNLFTDYMEYITPYDGYAPYDILLQKYDDMGKKLMTIYLEIKVREVVYDEYYLETKKINDIKKLAEKELYQNPEEYKIYYLNFTPTGTYLWNTKVVENIPITKGQMNKATMTSKTDKVSKTKWDLPISKAKRYDYIWTEEQLKSHYDEYFGTIVKDKIEKKGGLDWLFEK